MIKPPAEKNIPLVSSVHKDCEYYKHDKYVNRKCCGGRKIKDIIEMIFCNGKSMSCSNCVYCKKYRMKK